MGAASQFTRTVLDHSKNPHNFGILKDPDFSHEATNRVCGDRIELALNLRNGRISEVRFTGRGCALSIAATSMLTTMILGQSLAQSRQIELAQILQRLGLTPDLRRSRINCAMLGLNALIAAIA